MATLEIRVDAKNSETKLTSVKRKLDDVSKSGDRVTSSNSKTSASFASMATKVAGVTAAIYAASQSVTAFVRTADEMSLVNSRLKLVTNSMSELTKVQNDLFQVAQNSRQEFTTTADLYSRMARATRDLGTSQKDLLAVTDTINKALIVSGASTQEASSAVTQLGQGLAAGVLRGEEFNSIMENGNRIAIAMADSLGVNLGQLRAMAAEGKLTAEVVIDALKGQADVVDSEFTQMAQTVGQSVTVLSNEFALFTQTLDSTFKTTVLLSDAIETASGWLKNFGEYIKDNKDDILHAVDFWYAAFERLGDGIEAVYDTVKLVIAAVTMPLEIELLNKLADDMLTSWSMANMTVEERVALMEKIRKKYVEINRESKKGIVPDTLGEDLETIAKDWGDTLNSSVSNALVDALTNGDIMGAVQGLGASISASMIQASVANIGAGGELMSMGGLGGIASGVGVSLLSQEIFGDSKSAKEKEDERYLRLMNKLSESVSNATRAFDEFGKTGSSLRAELIVLSAELSKLGFGFADSRVEGEINLQIQSLINKEMQSILPRSEMSASEANKIYNLLTSPTTTPDAQPAWGYLEAGGAQTAYGFDREAYEDMKDRITELTIKQQTHTLTLEESDELFMKLTSTTYETGKNFEWLFDVMDASILQSEANIKSWEDSFKSPTELATDMADTLGVELADSIETLSDLFNQLANDADGLTDADLKLLNSNRDIIKQRVDDQNAYLQATQNQSNNILGIVAQMNGTYDDFLVNLASMEYLSIWQKYVPDFDMSSESIIKQWQGYTADELPTISSNLTESLQKYDVSSEDIATLTSLISTIITAGDEYQSSIASVANENIKLTDITNGLSDSLDEFSTSLLESTMSTFDAIASASRGFADTMFANNLGYQGGLYTKFLGEAESLADIIAGGNYTQSDVSALSDAVSSASKYGLSYFQNKTFGNIYEESFQKTVAANRFLEIESLAKVESRTIADVVYELERLREQSSEQNAELLSVQTDILEAQNEIALLQANQG